MQQTIEHRRGQDGVIKDFAPIKETFVAGDDQAGAFVTAGTPLNKKRGWMKLTNNAFKSPILTTPSPDKT
jgi:hypothetical protein